MTSLPRFFVILFKFGMELVSNIQWHNLMARIVVTPSNPHIRSTIAQVHCLVRLLAEL